MTVDIEKLEELAKAAPAGPWYGPDELSHKGMVFDCDLGSLLSYESIESERDVCIAYVAAANPAALLELIKDLKRNQRMLLSAVCQLGEISAALGADMDSDCDELIGMIEDIRAENAGLKTGYEAYERVNAELTQRIANLELCQTASLGVSGIIKSAASELGFDAAGEDSALDHLIGLARSAAALRAECKTLRKDKDRLDALEGNFWDIRHSSEALADSGDYTSGVEVIGHWMDKPFERVIGENYNENLRAAIDQAMAADAYPPARPEYEFEIPDFGGGNGNKARRKAAALGIDYDAAMSKEQSHD